MDNQVIRFGIKHKMVLSITLILMVAIGLNLYFSQNVLEKDKTAYIFENGLNKVESTSEQFTSFIQQNINLINIIAAGGLEVDELKNIVANDNDVEYLSYKKSGDTNWNILKNNDINFEDSLIDDVNNNSQVKLIPTKFEDKAALLISSGDYKFHLIISLKDIGLNFLKDKIFTNALIDGQGKFFIKSEVPQNVINQIIKNKSQQGTMIVENGKDEFLVSFSKKTDSNYTFLNVITKESAFFVFKALLLKNIFFSLSVLGGCLVLTIIFSNKIIIPILDIIHKTKEIAKGNFDTEINIDTNDELKILGDSVGHMSSEIQELLSEKEVMIEKLQDYNENLEQMVAQRTAELQSAKSFIEAMINSLDQGLFVFDENGNCSNIYTKATEEIFNISPSNKHFKDVVRLDEKESANFEKWSKMLFANMLPFDSAKELGIKTRRYETEDDYKSIKIQYFPMRDEDDRLQNVVTVATDVTSEMKAIEAFNEKDAYVSMILKLIRNKNDFFAFIEEAKEMLKSLIIKAQNKIAQKSDGMIVFHTMNGTFATFHVSHISLYARQTEELITKSEESELSSILVGRSEEMLGLIEDLLEEMAKTLGMNENFKDVATTDLISFKKLLESKNDSTLLAEFTEKFEYKSINESLKKYIELVEKLSERLGKPMAPIEVVNGEMKIDQHKYQEFFNSLVHLFRNCMDHGIEDSSTRKENGKDTVGHIFIDAQKIKGGHENYLQLKIQDDGGGLNTERIRSKLIELNIPGAAEFSDHQLFESIFLPNFSTKDEVSELSGRGIGMSAIKDSLDKLGGKIEIDSKKGKGSAFTFLLPL